MTASSPVPPLSDDARRAVPDADVEFREVLNGLRLQIDYYRRHRTVPDAECVTIHVGTLIPLLAAWDATQAQQDAKCAKQERATTPSSNNQVGPPEGATR